MNAARQTEPATPMDPTKGLFRVSFHALGTHCALQYRAHDIDTARSFQEAAVAWLRRYEATFSRFLPGSALSQVNAQAGRDAVPVSAEFDQLLDLCDQLYDLSRGINDPTSLPLTRLWDRAAECQELPTEAELKDTLKLVGWNLVERRPGKIRLPHAGMSLDFGGFGKEFAVDRVAHIAREYGIRDILVDLGRDIVTSGRPHDQPVWVVGIEGVHTPDVPLARAALSGQAMASSGNYRRFRMIRGKRYGHIIDPRSGRPADTEIEAVTCIAKSCLVAGFCARTAFILGVRQGIDLIESQAHVDGIIQTATRNHQTRKFYQYEIPNPH